MRFKGKKKRKGSRPRNSDDSDADADDSDSDDSDEEEEADLGFSQKQTFQDRRQRTKQNQVVQCNHRTGMKYNRKLATTDPITNDTLDKVHVDWTSPDGSLRMCYNLLTMVEVARTKGMWCQPPHFRTRLEQSLISKSEKNSVSTLGSSTRTRTT